MKNRTFWLIGIILVVANSINAQTKQNLTQLIDSALQNNYLLKASQQQTKLKATDIEILTTNFLPKIGTSASFSFWNWLMPNKQKLLGNSLTDFYTDITAYQTIYDWGKNKTQKSVVNNEIAIDNEIIRQIKNTIVYGVTNSYFEILKAQTEVRAYQNNIEQLKAQLKFAENLMKIGKVSNIDLLKINLQLSVSEKNKEKAINSVKAQVIKLINLCNLKNTDELSIVNTTDSIFSAQNSTLFVTENLYQTALKNNPTMLISEQKNAMELKQKEISNLQNRPDLFSYGIASWEHGYIPFGANFNFNIGVGIKYTLPYWGGSAFKTKMKQSDIRIQQIKEEKNQSFQDIKQEIDATLNTLKDIREENENYKRVLKLADETFKNATVLYQSGQGNIIDILDAQSIYTDAAIKQEKSAIEFIQGLNKLNYITGNDNYPF
jgi:outer membrane protein